MAIFEEYEGIDIYHAAGIATASLFKAVENNMIDKDKIVMLNITGGGEKRMLSGHTVYHLKPSHVFPIDVKDDEILNAINRLF